VDVEKLVHKAADQAAEKVVAKVHELVAADVAKHLESSSSSASSSSGANAADAAHQALAAAKHILNHVEHKLGSSSDDSSFFQLSMTAKDKTSLDLAAQAAAQAAAEAAARNGNVKEAQLDAVLHRSAPQPHQRDPKAALKSLLESVRAAKEAASFSSKDTEDEEMEGW